MLNDSPHLCSWEVETDARPVVLPVITGYDVGYARAPACLSLFESSRRLRRALDGGRRTDVSSPPNRLARLDAQGLLHDNDDAII